jgi:hypothetical protein
VATEINLETAGAVSEEDLLTFFARALDATLMDPDGSRYLRASGMDISPYAIDPDDPEEYEYRVTALGFRRRTLVVFRMKGGISPDEREEVYRQLVKVVLEYFSTHPEDGVLLHYGEYVMLECRAAQITIDSGLDDFMEDPLLTEIVAGYPHRKLHQPFL